MEVIKVKNFSKSFLSRHIHKDVNFSVKKGECLGLLGGSGAGKSIILRSLIGLEKPDTGHILINETDITNMTEEQLFEIRKKVAYVFQYGALFDSMSVYDNLAYPLIEHTKLNSDEIKSKIISLLNEFNLSGIDHLYPSELSGGMQKRVGMARAIILQPEVILYDEPTAGLDPANTITIQELILKMKFTGTSSILVTHDMDTALAVCDRICFLRNGIVEDLDTVENLKKDKENILKLFLRGENE